MAAAAAAQSAAMAAAMAAAASADEGGERSNGSSPERPTTTLSLTPRQPATGALGPQRRPAVVADPVDLSSVGKENNDVVDDDEEENSMGSEIIPKLSDTDEDEEDEANANANAKGENGPTGRKAATVPLDLTCV